MYNVVQPLQKTGPKNLKSGRHVQKEPHVGSWQRADPGLIMADLNDGWVLLLLAYWKGFLRI